jgi:hypothetical protein
MKRICAELTMFLERGLEGQNIFPRKNFYDAAKCEAL